MSRRCLFGLLVLIGAGSVSGDNVNVKLGGEVNLKADNVKNTDLKSSITWKHKDDAGSVTKVIEWDSYDQKIETPNDKFKGHAELDSTTGELTLKDLKLEHSGLYTIEIRSQEQEKKITLTVMEVVPKPKLSKESTKNPDVLYLVCEYNAKINWKCSNEKEFDTAPLDSPKKGQSLTFNRTGNPEVCCTCTLTNAVSEETSDPLCEKDLFPEKKSIEGVGLWFLIFFICIFILFIVLIILYLYIDSFHDRVHFSCKDTPFIRDVLGRLDNYRPKTRPGETEEGAKANGDDRMMKNAGPGETEEGPGETEEEAKTNEDNEKKAEKVELMTGQEA